MRCHYRIIACLGTAALALASPLAAQQSERFELRGTDVAIYNLAGDVTIEPGSGAAVVVELRRGGSDASRLTVERGPIDGRETLRVLYPGNAIVYRRDRDHRASTRLWVRDDGTFGDARGDHDPRGRGRRVHIDDSGSGLEAYADLRITVPAGRTVAVFIAVGGATATNVRGNLHIDGHALPVSASGIRGRLSVDLGSGSARVTDVEGDVDVDTGSGQVDVSDVRGPRLRVDTGSGSVTASRVAVRNLDIDTGSGSITVSDAAAEEIVLDTGSGSVRLELTSNARNVTIDTGSGSVVLTVPESFGAEVAIETGSGGIDLEVPLEVRHMERRAVSGRIGDGSGRLVIDTGSGSVVIRRGR